MQDELDRLRAEMAKLQSLLNASKSKTDKIDSLQRKTGELELKNASLKDVRKYSQYYCLILFQILKKIAFNLFLFILFITVFILITIKQM